MGRRSCSILLVLASSGAAAPAQDPSAPAPSWSLEIGLSVVETNGNADAGAAGLRLDLERTWKLWTIELEGKGNRHTRDSTTTAESYELRLTGRRTLNGHWSLYGREIAERNRFTGLDLRNVSSIGAHRQVAGQDEGPSLDLLFGLAWEHEERTVGPSDGFGSLQGEIDGTLPLSTTSTFAARLTLHQDLSQEDNTRVDLDLELQTAVNSWLALRLSYDLRFDNEPVARKTTTDTQISASLVLAFGAASATDSAAP